MGVNEEADEEDSDGDDGASCISGGDGGGDEGPDVTVAASGTTGENGSGGSVSPDFAPEPDIYVQAFSHFSYRNNTRRKTLVCDLQGVETASSVGKDRAGVFELADPVIHYRSKSRSGVYGRTDLGKKGIHRFFETHQYNDACRLLGLSG